MLKRLYADNYCALVNFELKLGKLNLLLGGNGSGKSTVMNLLGSIADFVVRGQTAAKIFAYTRTLWEDRNLQRFELDVEGEGGRVYRYALEIQHGSQASDPIVVRSESVSCDGDVLYRLTEGEVRLHHEDGSQGPVFPFRADRSYLPNVGMGKNGRTLRLDWFLTWMSRTGVLQPNPFAMEFSSKGDQPFLSRSGSNFPAFYDYLNGERPQVRTELERCLADAFPGFINFKLPKVGLDVKLLRLEFKEAEYTIPQLSEGQRALLLLYAATLALVGAGSIFCFDEPDNFVSLVEIQLWLQTLRDTLEEQPSGQAIIVSHHPEVIDYLALDSVWHFERPSGPTVVRPFELDRSTDLKLSEFLVRGG